MKKKLNDEFIDEVDSPEFDEDDIMGEYDDENGAQGSLDEDIEAVLAEYDEDYDDLSGNEDVEDDDLDDDLDEIEGPESLYEEDDDDDTDEFEGEFEEDGDFEAGGRLTGARLLRK